jgi:hypothetical protein
MHRRPLLPAPSCPLAIPDHTFHHTFQQLPAGRPSRPTASRQLPLTSSRPAITLPMTRKPRSTWPAAATKLSTSAAPSAASAAPLPPVTNAASLAAKKRWAQSSLHSSTVLPAMLVAEGSAAASCCMMLRSTEGLACGSVGAAAFRAQAPGLGPPTQLESWPIARQVGYLDALHQAGGIYDHHAGDALARAACSEADRLLGPFCVRLCRVVALAQAGHVHEPAAAALRHGQPDVSRRRAESGAQQVHQSGPEPESTWATLPAPTCLSTPARSRIALRRVVFSPLGSSTAASLPPTELAGIVKLALGRRRVLNRRAARFFHGMRGQTRPVLFFQRVCRRVMNVDI